MLYGKETWKFADTLLVLDGFLTDGSKEIKKRENQKAEN